MGLTPASPATADSVRRIGVFGGAFDPPHVAHIALAQAAVKQLALNSLHVIPTGQAWHKARALSPPEHRLAMAHLAFDGLDGIEVDEREIRRPGPTFTIDTLQALQAENPGAQLFLIIGADQYAAFRQWHRWADILKLAIICIAGRVQLTGTPDGFYAQNAPEALPGAQLVVLELPLMPVSATQVRQLAVSVASHSTALAGLVPDAIARYISLHQLYRAA